MTLNVADILNIPLMPDDELVLSVSEKNLIIEKLFEAHKLAKINVEMGNITHRGFAANICNNEGLWALATNFNNTRNDISSICAERSAILSLYNSMLKEKLKNNDNSKFDFKIKYICMANELTLDKLKTPPIPCEDCLSWISTNRYFDNKTIIFSFDKDENNTLVLKAQKLSKILPYKGILTSNKYSQKQVKYTDENLKQKISEQKVLEIMNETYKLYQKNTFTPVSNQNIVCTILANDEKFSAGKIDWTKRWFTEPLELAAVKAIEKHGVNTHIQAVFYFGDEFSSHKGDFFQDGVVSIKSLGRIRQKYADCSTPLVLNFEDYILVTSIGDYLPEKFIHGYKIK